MLYHRVPRLFEALAAAILDRLLHRSNVINIKGRSYRLRDLEAALKNANA